MMYSINAWKLYWATDSQVSFLLHVEKCHCLLSAFLSLACASPMHTLTNTLPVKLSGQLSGFILSLCLFALLVLSADLSQPASCCCCRTTRVQRSRSNINTAVWTSVNAVQRLSDMKQCWGSGRRWDVFTEVTDDMAAALPVCYHGCMSKKECEDLLGKKNKDGAYLIRDSETIQGAMCLCV